MMKVEEIRRIKLAPGEKLIVKLPPHTTMQHQSETFKVMCDVFGRGNFIIISSGVEVSATQLTEDKQEA